MEEHRARAVRTLADLKLTFQDVPDLREVVLVQRMVRAGLIAHEPGIGLGRALGPGMEEHLAPLPRPPQRRPRPVVDVDSFHWLMIGRHDVTHRVRPSRRQSSRPERMRRRESMIVAPEARLPHDGGAAMATISKIRTPRALAQTARWAEPGSKSAALFARAQGVLPGGNSRTTVYMAPYPPYAAAGEGCWITDVEGDRRLDCLNNYTALIHGHAHPQIVDAASRRLALGASFPMPTPEGDRAGGAAVRAAALGRARPIHQLGQRGRDDRDQGRARLHGPPEDREVRGRVPRLVRLRRGEPVVEPRNLGESGGTGQHRVLEGDAAGGARGRRRAAVESPRARRRPHRARSRTPGGGAGRSRPQSRRPRPRSDRVLAGPP